jgi:hypothetical protein
MDVNQRKRNARIVVNFPKKISFNNEKLSYFNYLEYLLKFHIKDIIMVLKTIFIIISDEKYDQLQYRKGLMNMLRLILEKYILIIPETDDFLKIFYSIYEKEYIEHISIEDNQNYTYVKIKLKYEHKFEFFKRYKIIFDDVSIFLTKLTNKRFKFIFK